MRPQKLGDCFSNNKKNVTDFFFWKFNKKKYPWEFMVGSWVESFSVMPYFVCVSSIIDDED
jgi:hypothetical protein